MTADDRRRFWANIRELIRRFPSRSAYIINRANVVEQQETEGVFDRSSMTADAMAVDELQRIFRRVRGGQWL